MFVASTYSRVQRASERSADARTYRIGCMDVVLYDGPVLDIVDDTPLAGAYDKIAELPARPK